MNHRPIFDARLPCSLLALPLGLLLACSDDARIELPGDLDPQVRAHVLHLVEDVEAAPEETEPRVELALALVANELWNLAADQLDKLAERSPEEPLAPYYRAIVSRALGANDQALQRSVEITKRFPFFAPGHHLLGELAFAEGDLDTASVAWRTATELSPDSLAPHLGLLDVALAGARWEEALARSEDLLKRWPVRAVVYRRGLALRGLGRSAEAERDLRTGAEPENPAMPDPWRPRLARHALGLDDQVRRAQSLLRSSRAKEAEELLAEALAWHPGNVDLLIDLAIAERRQGKAEAAVARLEKARVSAPGRFEIPLNLSVAALDQERVAAAVREAEEAVALGDSVPETHLQLARSLHAAGRSDAARDAADRAGALAPTDPIVWSEVARARLRAADPRALAACQRIVELAPLAVAGPLCIAESALAEGRRELLDQALARARRLSPGHPQIGDLERRAAASAP